jgi:hypothetical protein
MKTTEQNQKEVLTYLEKSSKQFFVSEDGNHFQTIIKLKDGKFIFVRDGEIFPINVENYTKEGETAGRTFLKYQFHPTYNPSHKYWPNVGHGPSKKMKAVKRTKDIREKIKNLTNE